MSCHRPERSIAAGKPLLFSVGDLGRKSKLETDCTPIYVTPVLGIAGTVVSRRFV